MNACVAAEAERTEGDMESAFAALMATGSYLSCMVRLNRERAAELRLFLDWPRYVARQNDKRGAPLSERAALR